MTSYFRTDLINVLCGVGTFSSFDLHMGNRKLVYRMKNEYVYSYLCLFTTHHVNLG